jgi:outer membrane protein insertion porin family
MRLSFATATRLGTLTSLGAITSLCSSQQLAQAATTTAPTPDRNWVIPTESPELASSVTIAPPESLARPESKIVAARLPEASVAEPVATPAPPAIAPIATTEVRSGRAADLVTTPRQLASATIPVPAARLPQLAAAPAATPARSDFAIDTETPVKAVSPIAKPIAAKPVTQPIAIAPPIAKDKAIAIVVPPAAKPIVSKPTTPKPVAQKPTPAKPPVAKPPVAKPPVAKPPVAKPPTPPVNPTLSPDLAVTILNVQIAGVDPEIQAILRDRLATRSGRQSSLNQIRQDLANILDTELVSSANFTTQLLDSGINVTFQATPVTVQRVELRNAQILTPEIANRIFQPQIGQAIQPSRLDQGIRDINQWYNDNGYTLSRAIDVEPNRNGNLKLTVKEGTIDELKIRFVDEFGRTVDDAGKTIKGKTKDSFIRQEIKSKQGDIFQVSKIQADLQNLLKTGLFVNAGVTLEGDDNQTTVVYNVAEGSNRQANLGGGFSSDAGIFGSATYNDSNFGGQGNQLGGKVLIGSKDLQFNGKFTSPFRDSNPNRWGYSINAFRERGISRVFDDAVLLANGDSVREGKIGAGVGLTKSLGNGWNGAIDLNYARTSQRDGSGNVVSTDSLGNPLSLSGRGIDDQVTLGFTAGFNQVDNPNDPKKGSRLRLSTEQGIPIGIGSAAANKLTADFTQYIPINILNKDKTNRDKQEVFAFNVQGGTTIGALAPYKAFTLGGADSVRGYGQGELGIGRSYIQASAEYRFPLISALGGTLFADYATDLGSASLVPGAPGNDRDRPGNGFGVGAGLRFKSPLGLLRADWGFTDSGTNRLQFTIGEKF